MGGKLGFVAHLYERSPVILYSCDVAVPVFPLPDIDAGDEAGFFYISN